MSLTEAWCRTYTLLVPEEEAARRRAEVESHVHEARTSGASVPRLTAETVLGAVSDLVWIDRARRRAGGAPLLLVPMLDAAVGAIVAGVLVLIVFSVSTLPGDDPDLLNGVVSYLALTIACSGHVAALVRRRRGR